MNLHKQGDIMEIIAKLRHLGVPEEALTPVWEWLGKKKEQSNEKTD